MVPVKCHARVAFARAAVVDLTAAVIAAAIVALTTRTRGRSTPRLDPYSIA